MLARLFGCRHAHTLRERDDQGILWLVCPCGRKVQALQRSETERLDMRAKFQAPVEMKARKMTKREQQRRLAERLERFQQRPASTSGVTTVKADQATLTRAVR